MASDVFSMQGEAKPTVEGMQLGLEQSPGRKTPPLPIETRQISLSALDLVYISHKNCKFLSVKAGITRLYIFIYNYILNW